MPSRLFAAAAVLAPMLVFAARSPGQGCSPWWAGNLALHDPDDGVYCFAEFDDGRGPALYCGGRFTHTGGAPAAGVARWDGRIWEPLGGGTPGTVRALAVYDDGTGAALYAGGLITEAGGAPGNGIARWRNGAWERVGQGVNGSVSALRVFDAGSGPALYVGGNFTAAGGVPSVGAARWDGSWSGMEGGLTGSNIYVGDIEVFDGGAGPALYYAGRFDGAGALASPNLAKWDGAHWVPTPAPPPTSTILGLATWRETGRTLLMALGRFDPLPTSLAAFDGVQWSAFSSPPDAISLAALDDGSGPGLFVGEVTQHYGPDGGVKRWTSFFWEPVGEGLATRVEAMTSFDDGSGRALFAGGELTRSGQSHVQNIARWDGSRWRALDESPSAPNGLVAGVAVYDDGGVPAVLAGGSFSHAGGTPASNVARWDGQRWSGFNGDCGLGAVAAVAALREPAGTRIYAGGGEPFEQWNTQPCLSRWDGSAWALVPGVPELLNCFDCGPQVYALLPRREGNEEVLYVGGYFHRVGGIASASIARWDGRQWRGLGAGLQGSLGPFASAARVYAIVEYDDGSGPSLFASGTINFAGGEPALGVARWDGQRWWPLGSGIYGWVYALAVHEEGGRRVLVAGGRFPRDTYHVAKWDGAAWTPMPGLPERVYALRDFDAGDGVSLYAGGDFVLPGGEPGLARWDGARWVAHQGGVRGTRFTRVSAMTLLPGPTGPSLLLGGSFSRVGGVGSSNVALWHGCADFCYADCDTSTGPHSLDIFDFLCFQNAYAAAEPYACDCDTTTGPGVCDIFDFTCFQNAFAAGCP